MNIIPFQFGSQKIIAKYEKRYHPFLYRMGRRRYAGRGQTWFRTSSDALTYAKRWAARAERVLVTEVEHVN
jgi:hypothetical protein